MLIHCLRSYSQDWNQLDTLGFLVQRLGGWISIGYLYVDFYVPENTSYMLWLVDDQLTRRLDLDYIV